MDNVERPLGNRCEVVFYLTVSRRHISVTYYVKPAFYLRRVDAQALARLPCPPEACRWRRPASSCRHQHASRHMICRLLRRGILRGKYHGYRGRSKDDFTKKSNITFAGYGPHIPYHKPFGHRDWRFRLKACGPACAGQLSLPISLYPLFSSFWQGVSCCLMNFRRGMLAEICSP